MSPRRVRVDCHLHTVHSGDAVTTVDRLAERVREERLDVVCVTDHHTLAGAHEALSRDIGARVVVGEEIRTHAGEIIGLFLTSRVPYVLPLEEAVRRVRSQGGLVYAPHPFDAARTSLGAEGLARLTAMGALDVVEVFNAKVTDREDNRRAAAFADEHDLPAAAGSDAHDPQGLGAAWVEMPDFDGPCDFAEALREGRVHGELRPHVGFLPGRA
ncbi:PHP domain-containing protein [Actinomadura sp. DC4]|uniref:PHP domain-containing protein n=1 Tax=Actinomadura sp. DC4 TaxID=3055069 RepID=UPI0025B0AB51|nr:PHP domain-containing protein [Actinomadura sp. DC4]MDN3359648.1 PHP domain-containing protein [Actinomadura sp. DC4]